VLPDGIDALADLDPSEELSRCECCEELCGSRPAATSGGFVVDVPSLELRGRCSQGLDGLLALLHGCS
jgi:hypothetical protein